MAIFYNLGACEVLPHHPGKSVSYKKAISGFFALLLQHPSPEHQVVPFFRVFFFFDTFTSTLINIEEKIMHVFKLIFVL